jgi:hypothetical protein
MPEAALPRLDAERRARLAALGLDLLALRAELGPALPAGAEASVAAPRLGVAGIAWPSSDRLLCGIVAALGVPPADVASGPAPGGITLQIGAGDPVAGAFALPELASLRDARAKRALWPALRALRRHLAGERTG